MKRVRLVVRASDRLLDLLGAKDTGEAAVAAVVAATGLAVEEVEGLDWWPDPPSVEATGGRE